MFSLQSKFLVTYMATILTLITMAFFTFTAINSKREREQYLEMMSLINDRISYHFQTIQDNVRKNAEMHILEPTILAALSTETYADSQQYYKDLENIKRLFRQYSILDSFLVGATYVGASGAVYDNTGGAPGYMETVEEYQRQADSSPTGGYVSAVHMANIKRKQIKVISYTQKLTNPYTQKDIGYLTTNINFDHIFDSYRSRQDKTEGSLFMVLQGDQIVYHSAGSGKPAGALEQELVRLARTRVLRESPSLQIKAGNGSQYFLVVNQLPESDLYLIQSIPVSYMTLNRTGNVTAYLLIVLAIAATAVAVGYLLTFKLSSPIHRLVVSMDKVARGIPETIPLDRDDEMGVLFANFNRMSTRIVESKERERLFAEQQRESEIRLLQAQINPHFIYNTLNLISSIANLENNPMISQIAIATSRMLYYNLKAGDFVAVSMEIDQIKRYMTIQRIRFPEKFSESYSIDPAVERLQILKFILQPLVENAVYHGLEKKAGRGRVEITVRMQEGKLLLCVEDNGLGIEAEQLRSIQDMLVSGDAQRSMEHMGIWNVHDRVRHYYGGQYGLAIDSTVHVGTKVTIALPIVEDRGEGVL